MVCTQFMDGVRSFQLHLLIESLMRNGFLPAVIPHGIANQYNHFVSQFPQFNYNIINHQIILEYYHCVVDYAHPHGVFVLPLCTSHPGHKFGTWLSEILPHIQHEVETICTGLIATGLSSHLTTILAKCKF